MFHIIQHDLRNFPISIQLNPYLALTKPQAMHSKCIGKTSSFTPTGG